MTTHDPVHPPSGPSHSTHAVLVPGWWLGGWAWELVEPDLRAAGITPHAITLPGLDTASTDHVTFDDHVDTIIELVDRLDGDVVLVGHSGGGAVVHAAADRRPGRIRRVIYVDTGPPTDGDALRPDVDGDLPFPSDDELAAHDLSTEGLDDAALTQLRRRAVAHPGGVAGARIHLGDPARLEIPATVVCTSLPSEVLRQMLEQGHLTSDLTQMRDVRYVDLPTGHWPMLSRPADLAAALAHEIPVPHPAQPPSG